MKNKIIFIFTLIFLFGSLSSASVLINLDKTTYPTDNFSIVFRALNSTTLQSLTSSEINCQTSLFNVKGMMTQSNNAVNSSALWKADYTNVSEGEYQLFIYCYGDDYGSKNLEVSVTKLGYDVSKDKIYLSLFIVTIFIIGIISLILTLIHTDNPYVKISLFAPLYLVINFTLTIVNHLTSLFLNFVPYIHAITNALQFIINIGGYIVYPMVAFVLLMYYFQSKEINRLTSVGFSNREISRLRKRR